MHPAAEVHSRRTSKNHRSLHKPILPPVNSTRVAWLYMLLNLPSPHPGSWLFARIRAWFRNGQHSDHLLPYEGLYGDVLR